MAGDITVGLPPSIMTSGNLIGTGIVQRMSSRPGFGTADGGRYARIDMLMDDANRPAGPRGDRAKAERVSRMRKIFCVNPETRQGGSGLYDYKE